MKIRFIIDTNLFLRFLLRDIEAQYTKVGGILRRAKSGRVELFVPQIVIFEIVFALEKYYKLPRDKVKEYLKTILTANYLKIQDREIFDEALDVYLIKNISLVDCFLLSLAKLTNAEVLSFDQHLKN